MRESRLYKSKLGQLGGKCSEGDPCLLLTYYLSSQILQTAGCCFLKSSPTFWLYTGLGLSEAQVDVGKQR